MVHLFTVECGEVSPALHVVQEIDLRNPFKAFAAYESKSNAS
jgi:hypothetical protein